MNQAVTLGAATSATSPGTGHGAGGNHISTSSTTITRRLRLRRDGGPPFVWAGLLPTLGLVALAWWALAPFARNDVEASVDKGVRAALDAQGMAWVKTTVSGQQVFLSGNPPEAGAGDKALEIARAATCPTWTGQRVCPELVVGAFGAISAPSLPTLTAPAVPAVSASLPSLGGAAASAAQACEQSLAQLVTDAKIEFASGSARIDAKSGPLLDRLAQAAKACPGKVSIEGHTDNIGDADANVKLSQARANAVRDALARRGMDAARLNAAGFGEQKPKADNNTAEGRATNRRIEFRAVPN